MLIGKIEENIPIPTQSPVERKGKSKYGFESLKPATVSKEKNGEKISQSRLYTVEIDKGENFKKLQSRVRGAMTAFHRRYPGKKLRMRREKDFMGRPLNAVRVWRVDEGKV
ncbi:MAG: hypothetical protein C4576_11485 [Desulfobacteraceae bacterium]|nr:MAG: hypothetical protein C4576_11485 [Desulfobacteraceae bacterium]